MAARGSLLALYRFAKPCRVWLQQQADVTPGRLSARDLYTLYPSLTSVPPRHPCSQASGMEARQGGDSFAGSVHDSPPRQGDARERYKQENNKTDRNESSRKKKKRKIMTRMKRLKHTSERPRNERCGASARPFLPALTPCASAASGDATALPVHSGYGGFAQPFSSAGWLVY